MPAMFLPYGPVPALPSPPRADDASADARRWRAAGDLHWQLGEPSLAVRAYQEAIRCAPEAPEAPEAWLSLARVREARGDLSGGAQAYARAQSCVMPDDAPHEPTHEQWSRLRRVHQRMARYRLARGDAEGALTCLQSALEAARYGGEMTDARADIRLRSLRSCPAGDALHTLQAHAALLAWLGDDRTLAPAPTMPDMGDMGDARPTLPHGMVLGGVWLPLR